MYIYIYTFPENCIALVGRGPYRLITFPLKVFLQRTWFLRYLGNRGALNFAALFLALPQKCSPCESAGLRTLGSKELRSLNNF